MNNSEVVAQVAEKSGVDEGTCSSILKQVEEVSGASVLGAVTGKGIDAEAIAEMITAKINLPKDIIIKVINALNDVLSKGVLDKINPFKK